MSENFDSAQIAIIGAGAAGLAAAVLLRQKGIAVTVFEKRSGSIQFPQAHGVNTRSSEILQEMGAFDDLAAHAAPVERIRAVAWVESLAGYTFGTFGLTAKADTGIWVQRLQHSPSRRLNVGQDRYEEVLLKRLRQLGGDVKFNHTASDPAVEDGRAALTVTASDGVPSRHRFDYVLACDGAGSTLRRGLAIEMTGPSSLARFATAYFHADLSPYMEGRWGPVTFIVGEDVHGSIIGFDIRTSWAFMCVMPPDAAAEDFSPPVMEELVRRAIGDPAAVIDLKGVSTWNMSAQVATQFRKGPFFLVGDAAHRFPPTGGLGLNTGVQDAHNLAWKLAFVLQGRADRDLLDSYEPERKPIAVQNCEHSVSNARNMSDVDQAIGRPALSPVDPAVVTRPPNPPTGLGVPEGSPEAKLKRQRIVEALERQGPHFGSSRLELGFGYGPSPDEGQQFAPRIATGFLLPHGWIDGPAGTKSTRDLCATDRMTLLVGPEAERDGPLSTLPFSDEDLRVVPLRRSWLAPKTALDAAVDKLVLVRPDQHVAWVGTPLDLEQLLSALAALGFHQHKDVNRPEIAGG